MPAALCGVLGRSAATSANSMIILLEWWLRQLAGMLPAALLKTSTGSADAVILEVVRHLMVLSVRLNGKTVRVAEADVSSEGAVDLKRALDAHGVSPRLVVLQLQPAIVLQKRLSLPLAARRHLQGLLSFEIDQETPFAADEVHWDYAVRREERTRAQLEVDLIVAPRTIVDPIVTLVRDAGFDLAGIEVAGDASDKVLLRLQGDRRQTSLGPGRKLVAAAALASILAVAAVVVPFIRQQQGLSAADAASAMLMKQAQEAATLRQSIDQFASTIERLKLERTHNGDALQVLAALTRILPDDANLTALSLRDGHVVVTGLSPAAAQLADLLARSPEFREPNFDAPVVANEDSGLEAFTISAALKTTVSR